MQYEDVDVGRFTTTASMLNARCFQEFSRSPITTLHLQKHSFPFGVTNLIHNYHTLVYIKFNDKNYTLQHHQFQRSSGVTKEEKRSSVSKSEVR